MAFPNDKQAFSTHLNYIKCLAGLFAGVTLQSNQALSKVPLPNVDVKKNLIELTKRSLYDERSIVHLDNDYSYASTSWLPVKAYYLVFNILLTVEYILKVQKSIFQMSHNASVAEFTRKLETREITFSEPILNQVFDQSILNFRSKSGANLSSKTSRSDMYKLAMRKIALYKVEDWKRKKQINLRRGIDRTKYQNYLNNFSVSIFDFLYLMRIRSNYRDFAFIEGVSSTDTAMYFLEFFNFTIRFAYALESLKSQLITLRT